MLKVKKINEIVTEGEEMDRIYIKIVGDFFSIYYKRTHSLIKFVNNKDDRCTQVDNLLLMCVQDFYTMLLDEGIVINETTNIIGKNSTFVEKESWYRGAWKMQTDKFFQENSLTNVKEGLPIELINKIMNKRARSRRLKDNLLEMNSKLVNKTAPKLIVKGKNSVKRLLREETYFPPTEML